MTADDDFEGVSKIVKWMSYVPDKKGSPVPISPTADDWDRDVVYFPPGKGTTYDVRHLIAGKVRPMRMASSLGSSIRTLSRNLLVAGQRLLLSVVLVLVASPSVSSESRHAPSRTLHPPILPTLTPSSKSPQRPVVFGTPTPLSRLLRLSTTSTTASSSH
jgi:hypothetical protein